MGEIIFHIILLVVLGLFFKESLMIETGRAADPIGPAGFPQAMIAVCSILLIISLYQAVRKYMKREKATTYEKPAEFSKEFFGILGIVSGYIIVVEYAGFIISTIIFFILLFVLLGRKINAKEIANALLLSFGFTLVFGTLLNLQLPRGIEVLKNLSYWIY